MRKPLSPLQALQADAAAAAVRHADLDAVLSDWVAAAQLACDLAATWGALAEQPPGLEQLLERDELLRSVSRPTMVHDGQGPPSGSLGAVGERLRVHAEAMEQQGCFELALTTVSAVCRLTARTDPAAHALATLHLGRIARQMNALDAAEDAYASAIARALHLGEPPIAARGYIGLALIADMRGNLPGAAEHYREALRMAVPREGAYLQALQGLMSLAVARNDLGEALVLGWTVYDASAEGSDARLSALSELSLVALKAGFPAQARAGFKVVLSSRPLSHQRLATLAGDVRAAARLGLADEVMRLEAEIRQEVARGNALHESTMAFVYLAEAQHRVGNVTIAVATLTHARALAARHGFHEYSFAVDALEREWASVGEAVASPTPAWSAASEDVANAIDRFAALT
jgi:tetratricopeptide (TPR) repeat protein